jgi:hypothetical protein
VPCCAGLWAGSRGLQHSAPAAAATHQVPGLPTAQKQLAETIPPE